MLLIYNIASPRVGGGTILEGQPFLLGGAANLNRRKFDINLVRLSERLSCIESSGSMS
jgi:hypothetical protein